VTRASKIVIAVLAALVVVGAIALPSLRRAVARLSGNQSTEEQARREMLLAPISTPTDVNVQAQLYWMAPGSAIALESYAVQLPLSADPTERSKQLLQALIEKPPSDDRRTLPRDATLLAFYIDPEGTAIADFSDELSEKTPSGILSEQLAVNSIAQTLGANVQGIQQLKILIHGQAADTLAGHVDLSVLFPIPHATLEAAPSATPVPGQTAAPGGQPSAPNSQPPAGGSGTPPANEAKPPAAAPPAAPANSAAH
jgi:hypothetical protein